MEWLWIPAVAFLGLFILVLCWLFFSDYTCCPCQRKRRPGPIILTQKDVPAVSIHTPVRASQNKLRKYPKTSSVGQYVPVYPKHSSQHPSYSPQHSWQSPQHSSHSPQYPWPSPQLHLKHGDIPLRQVITEERGIPTLNLHLMTVKEARQATSEFILQNLGQHRKVRIITGRGLHNPDGAPIIKPVIAGLLRSSNYKYEEINNGGCFLVTLS